MTEMKLAIFVLVAGLFVLFADADNVRQARRRIQSWCDGRRRRTSFDSCLQTLERFCRSRRRGGRLCDALQTYQNGQNTGLMSDGQDRSSRRGSGRSVRPSRGGSDRSVRPSRGGSARADRTSSRRPKSREEGVAAVTGGSGNRRGGRRSRGKGGRRGRRAKKVGKDKLKRIREQMSRRVVRKQRQQDRNRRARRRKTKRNRRRRRKRAKKQITELTVNNPDDYIGGDMDVTEEQATEILSDLETGTTGRRKKRKVGKGRYQLWDQSSIPISFDFAASVPSGTRAIIGKAIELWEKNTCLRWKEGGPNTNRVEFKDGAGCSSYVGMVNSGTQEITIKTPGCHYVGIISHEIGHSLGFFHEQARSDRDNYVDVDLNNVDFWYQNNFAKVNPQWMNDYNLKYDYGSVMHYSPDSFALNPATPTIQSLDDSYKDTMGQRIRPSFIDFAQVNKAYGCDAGCPSDSCQHSGYSINMALYENGKSCTDCICPEGIGGSNCETVEYSPCGNVMEAYRQKFTIESPNYPSRFGRGDNCAWLIKTTPGHKVYLNFVSTFDLACKEVCDENYVEVKMGSSGNDFRDTGARFCCDNPPTDTIASKGNEMVVLFRSQASRSTGFRANFWTDAPRDAPRGRTTAPPRPSIPRPTTTLPPTTRRTTTKRTGWGGWGSRGGSSGGSTGGSGGTETGRGDSGEVTQPAGGPGCDCGVWSQWSECSQPCGGCGSKKRSRSCSKEDCFNLEERKCNMQQCTGGQTFLYNLQKAEFFLLLDGCCIGLFKQPSGDCGGISSGITTFIKSLVPGFDKLNIPLVGNR